MLKNRRKKTCCTYWFSGWWELCCCQHDDDYYRSGKSRKESDNKLFKCVWLDLASRGDMIGSPILAILFVVFWAIVSLPIASTMWLGVRLFGKKRYTRKQNITKAKSG